MREDGRGDELSSDGHLPPPIPQSAHTFSSGSDQEPSHDVIDLTESIMSGSEGGGDLDRDALAQEWKAEEDQTGFEKHSDSEDSPDDCAVSPRLRVAEESESAIESDDSGDEAGDEAGDEDDGDDDGDEYGEERIYVLDSDEEKRAAARSHWIDDEAEEEVPPDVPRLADSSSDESDEEWSDYRRAVEMVAADQ